MSELEKSERLERGNLKKKHPGRTGMFQREITYLCLELMECLELKELLELLA